MILSSYDLDKAIWVPLVAQRSGCHCSCLLLDSIDIEGAQAQQFENFQQGITTIFTDSTFYICSSSHPVSFGFSLLFPFPLRLPRRLRKFQGSTLSRALFF